jgi:hypothetical protein
MTGARIRSISVSLSQQHAGGSGQHAEIVAGSGEPIEVLAAISDVAG